MKAKIIISVLTTLVMAACSSSYMAKSGNDDLYYTPGKGGSTQQSQTETVSATKNYSTSEKRSSGPMTDYEKYRASMENKEITDTTDGGQAYANNSDVQNAADSKEPVVKSEEYYGEGGDSYIYNNYYYASRLNRFHGGFYDPYFYDPFYFDTWYTPWYSSWYSPGWSFSVGWGWGYGYPYYDYHYPYYGGYWGYYGYNPYYYRHHHHYGYYDYGYGYGYGRWGSSYYSDRKYGRIPVRSNLTNTTYGRDRINNTGYTGSREKSTRGGSSMGTSRGGYTSSSGRRLTNDNVSTGRGSSERSVYTRRAPAENSGTVVNGRRIDNSGNSSRERTQQYSGSTGGRERTYTPSYTPRTYSRRQYNESSSSSSYSGNRGSSSSSSGYSRPSSSSSSSSGQSYRRESNDSYSRPSPSYTPSSSSNSSSSYSSGSSSRSSGGGGSSSSSSSRSGGGDSGGGGRRR